MIRVRVKFFALARELSGIDETILDIPPDANIVMMLDLLVKQFPKLREWQKHLRLAVNCTYAESDEILHDNDEVAVIPPVSGG